MREGEKERGRGREGGRSTYGIHNPIPQSHCSWYSLTGYLRHCTTEPINQKVLKDIDINNVPEPFQNICT